MVDVRTKERGEENGVAKGLGEGKGIRQIALPPAHPTMLIWHRFVWRGIEKGRSRFVFRHRDSHFDGNDA